MCPSSGEFWAKLQVLQFPPSVFVCEMDWHPNLPLCAQYDQINQSDSPQSSPEKIGD